VRYGRECAVSDRVETATAVMRLKALQVFAVASLAFSLSLTAAQRSSDSRDKTEKVGDVLAALEASPGKVIADVGAGGGSIPFALPQP
jgi:hypothetical protein